MQKSSIPSSSIELTADRKKASLFAIEAVLMPLGPGSELVEVSFPLENSECEVEFSVAYGDLIKLIIAYTYHRY